MSDETVPLVYNPASGGGRGAVRFRKAEAVLATRNIRVQATQTDHAGHATDLVRDLAEAGNETILVMGGDGTVSEAVNGVLETNKSPALGILPTGTGNDFLRDFGVTDMDEAMRRIAAGTTQRVDAAKITWDGGHRYSNNLFGTGFAAQVVELTNRRLKWMGPKGYTAATLAQLARLQACPTTIIADGQTIEGNIPMVAVCNTVYTGGAMKMAPGAQTDDGVLDLVTVQDVNRRQLLGLFSKIFEGTHIEDPKVTLRRVAHVRVEPDEPSPLLVDGEVMGQTPAEVQVMPGALKILV